MAFNVDLGPGDDSLTPGAPPDADVEPTAVTVTGGAGNDVIEVDARSATLSGEAGDDHLRGGQVTASGPWTMDGGDGDDTLLNSGARDLRMLGGAGDDRLITSMDDIATAIDCGRGADEVQPGFEDQPGAGCAPHLTELSVAGRGRIAVTGRVSAAATVKITVLTRTRERLASGTRRLRRAGRLRLTLRQVRPSRSANVLVLVTTRGRRRPRDGLLHHQAALVPASASTRDRRY